MSKKSPQLRFEDFTDDWEQRKLKDIFDVHTDFVSNGSFQALKENVQLYKTENYAYMIRLQDASNNWDGPWLYTDKQGFDFLDKSTVYKDDILMSDRGTIGKFFLVPQLDKPMTLSSNAVLLRSTKNDNNFIYYMLNTSNISNQIIVRTTPGVQPMISKTEFKKINTCIPNIEEQQKIGSFFQQLDETIALHQRKLDLLKEQKKGYLQKMFPKNGAKVPEFRFAGFADDWEERKLGEHAKYRRGSFPQPYGNKEWYDGEGAMPFVQVVDVTNKLTLVENTKQKISKLAQSKSVFVPKGTVVVTLQGSIGRVAITQYDSFVDRTLLIFEDYEKETDERFWAYTIQKKFEIEKLKAPGGTIKTITKEALSSFDVHLPQFKEQAKIGSFFKQLDDTIALHQRKLDLLKEQKKGYLQKMFPKNGAKVPELRFKGFTGDWEERKLGELVEQIIREVPKPNKPYYRMSVRSHAKGTFKQFVDNPENVAMDKLFVVKKDDLVVNITFAWEHAIAVVNEENDGLLVSHRFPTYRADGKSDIEFLHHVVSKENFRRKLEFISPGGAGRNRVLNKKDFLKLKIFVPKIEEQQKIGSFFKQLDNTIALHQRKLDLLKEQKKGFLQKMFV